METLYNVADLMIEKAEVGTLQLEGEVGMAVMGFFTLAFLLVFTVSILRWLVSTILKILTK